MRALARLACGLSLALAAACTGSLVRAGALLVPAEPPEWKCAEWINGNPGKLADLHGKVVLIEFFQMWCPVSNSFALPLFQRWEELYGGREDVALVAIHTVFEGHDAQSPDRLRRFVAEAGIRYPVGIDMHEPEGDPVPTTMRRFDNEGTPQVAIVDKFGLLRWSHFGEFDYRPVESFIDRLLLEKTSALLSESGEAEQPSPRSRKFGGDKSGAAAPGGTRGGRAQPPSMPSVGRRPPSMREPPPEATEEEAPEDGGEEEPEEEGEEPDPADEGSLSGKYRVTLQQTSKSCGEMLAPQTVFTDVTVSEGQMLVKFSRRYLEQQELTLDWAGSSFQTSAATQTLDRGVDVGLRLSVSGRFIEGRDPAELEFTFQLDETSQDGSMDCSISGTGTGTKTGR